ncbi:MarR family winged helix-turn-helix transcriptional regulator [Streptomyces sp. NPDC051569]|uniref:MarR family winged helix-turn-helix transcriptional regulator n=1 Tax=Streptomyces sp. NPDC051569 TaxID=3365661 RepID=UPI0037A80109
MEGPRPPASAEALREAAEQLAVSAEAVTEIAAGAAAAVDRRLLPHRLRILLIVQERPGINLTGAARAVGLTLPRASRVCGGMEAAGLLERRPVLADRRGIELALTPEGAALLADYRSRRAAEIAEVMRRMPAGERRHLLAGLRSFSSSLAAVRGE